MNHKLYELVLKLGVSTPESLALYNNGVRDRSDVNAYLCKNSGIILLDNINFSVEDTYSSKDGYEYFKAHQDKNGKVAQSSRITLDDEKRATSYGELIRGKRWLDFGCGQGGLAIHMRDQAQEVETVELQPAPRDYLNSIGIRCVSSLDEVQDESFDVITLFHVFEHLDDPIGLVTKISSKLKKGGKMIIEVPHAQDALLSLYGSEAFKKFTLWSEHLLLHTKHSLRRFLIETPLKVDSVKGVQRYPLSNHLYWLSQQAPGGHQHWSFLNTSELEESYASALASVDKTDSIVAYCSK